MRWSLAGGAALAAVAAGGVVVATGGETPVKAAAQGPAALRALGADTLFLWLGKMFYGIFITELLNEQEPLIKPKYPLAENAALLRRFGGAADPLQPDARLLAQYQAQLVSSLRRAGSASPLLHLCCLHAWPCSVQALPLPWHAVVYRAQYQALSFAKMFLPVAVCTEAALGLVQFAGCVGRAEHAQKRWI